MNAAFLYPVIGIIILLFSSSSPARETTYRIGPKDVLHLTIYAGGEKQREIEMVVSSRGKVNVPFLGEMSAEGLEVNELARQIAERLTGDYFIEPEVHLYVKEYHSLRYYIAGAVNEPGFYEINEKPTLLELIARAGGVLPERGNLAYILRDASEQVEEGADVAQLLSQGRPLTVALRRLLDEGDMTENKMLRTGDVVFIPYEDALDVAESKIYVGGEIRNPGLYRYQPGLTALNACLMAGGFDKFAAPNRTRIIRRENGKQLILKINLNDVSKGKRPDVQLKPGDRIYVPESWL